MTLQARSGHLLDFNPPPIWGVTAPGKEMVQVVRISNHAPRTGSGISWTIPPTTLRYFNPRSPWGKRRVVVDPSLAPNSISISAPRVGATFLTFTIEADSLFQSALLMWGATASALILGNSGQGFQSALPVWGAIPAWRQAPTLWRFQSAFPVWGATG